MSKRFTETTKWDDNYFFDLTPNEKLFYLYLLDKCDAVGVVEINKRVADMYIGSRIDIDKFLEHSSDRVMPIDGNKYWVIKFSEYQYGELKEESNSKPVQSHIKLLKKHCLWESYQKSLKGMLRVNKGYAKGIYTLKEKEQDKEKGKDKEQDKEKPMFSDFWELYNHGNKKSTFEKWQKLSQSQISEMLEKLPAYLASTPNGNFRKNGETYLNKDKEYWNDAIRVDSSSIPQKTYAQQKAENEFTNNTDIMDLMLEAPSGK